MITQESVREKLICKSEDIKQKYIEKEMKLPKGTISKFKNRRRNLREDLLDILDEFLDKF